MNWMYAGAKIFSSGSSAGKTISGIADKSHISSGVSSWSRISSSDMKESARSSYYFSTYIILVSGLYDLKLISLTENPMLPRLPINPLSLPRLPSICLSLPWLICTAGLCYDIDSVKLGDSIWDMLSSKILTPHISNSLGSSFASSDIIWATRDGFLSPSSTLI